MIKLTDFLVVDGGERIKFRIELGMFDGMSKFRIPVGLPVRTFARMYKQKKRAFDRSM